MAKSLVVKMCVGRMSFGFGPLSLSQSVGTLSAAWTFFFAKCLVAKMFLGKMPRANVH
jgi:hypothetical protein